ncbi:glycosyltransferase family 25 protein [Ancylobacter lacus]|uniref:glycosyltransferase family 25 protein n=1 Tax=Ancylobacter lacus TaxID=2579970 RepID=UPI001BD187BA|nr:glycosyltransferase family 25 protein [Ancylobacter lacus]MBS7538638.1 glycosyltransferase family 25 protein [Ancylobacter lacus]
MKCYLINLDRSPERLVNMAERFGRINVPFERVSGIDGKKVGIQPAVFYNADGTVKRRLAIGEVACFQSHRSCWRRIAEGEDAFGAVFEDDIIFSDKAGPFLTGEDWIPAGTDAVKIETMFQETLIGREAITLPERFKLAHLYHQHYGTAAYILSRAFAAYLVETYPEPPAPIDHVIFGPETGLLYQRKILQMTPSIAIQERMLEPPSVDEGGSLLEFDRMDAGASAARRGLRRFLRNIAKPFENLARRIEGRPRGYRGKVPPFAKLAVVPFGRMYRRPRR